MIAISFHIGRYSASLDARPLTLFDFYRHDEGYCLWAGPLGLVIYTKRWQPARQG